MELDVSDVSLKENATCPLCGSDKRRFFGARGPETHSIAKTFEATPALKKKLSEIKVYNCSNCDLLYCSPIPVYDQKASSAIYTEEYCVGHRSIEKDVMEFRIGKFAEELRFVLQKLNMPLEKGLRYLDIAAGAGDMVVAGSRIGLKSEGIDLSTQVCEFAKKVHGIDIMPYSVADPRLEEGAYDFISMKDIIEHITNPYEFLRDSVRLLKPGGGIYLTTPNERGLVMRFGNFVKGKGKTVNLSPCADPYHLLGFGHKSLDFLFDKVGLEIVNKKTVPVKLKMSGGMGQKIKLLAMNWIDAIGGWQNNASEFLIILRKKV